MQPAKRSEIGQNIVIKAADKRCVVFIIDTEQYTSIIQNMLQDVTYYEEVRQYHPHQVIEKKSPIPRFSNF